MLVQILTIVGRHCVWVRGKMVLLEWRRRRWRLPPAALVLAQEDVGEGPPQVLLLLLPLVIGYPAASVAAPGIL